MIEGYPTANVGDTIDMWVGRDDTLDPDGRRMYGLVRFDLSSIPTTAVVQSATLRMFYMNYADWPNTLRAISACLIATNWTELGVNWSNKPSTNGCQVQVTIAADTDWGWREWDVKDYAQGWLRGTWPNRGIMLIGPATSSVDPYWRAFYTREGLYPPEIVINYLDSVAVSDP